PSPYTTLFRSPYHLGLLLRRLVVICNQGIGIHRISIRQFPAWVLISKKYISYGLSTRVAWKVSLHHTFHQWLDGSDYTRTAFVQHQNNGLARFCQSCSQIQLVFRQSKIVQVAWFFGIGI